LRIIFHDLLGNGSVHQTAAYGNRLWIRLLDQFHSGVKPVELCGTACGWNHATKEDGIRSAPAKFVQHLLVIQAHGATVQNSNI
jgi:hypothetical protein